MSLRMQESKGEVFMARYVYPAVFTAELDGGYSVEFLDVPGCYTCGDSIEEAIEMAQDALALMLYEYEARGEEVPQKTLSKDIKLEEGQFVNQILCDTLSYQIKYNNKAVKKTVSIPAWLDQAATAAGVNFSKVLQEALKAKLNLL